MTDLVVSFINFMKDNLLGFLPTLNIEANWLTSISNGIDEIINYVSMANFLIPLPDICTILLIDIAIRIFKLSLFCGNWVIRRVLDVVP